MKKILTLTGFATIMLLCTCMTDSTHVAKANQQQIESLTTSSSGAEAYEPSIEITHKLNKKKYSGKMGKKFTLKISNPNETLKWESNNTKIATVSPNGKVKITGVGTTKVTATIDGKTYSCKVTGKSSFKKGRWADSHSSYKITKIKERKVYVTIKTRREKYNKVFRMNASGTKASITFKCKYKRKHVLSITYKKGYLNTKDTTACKRSLK